jgi:hypothetical protein
MENGLRTNITSSKKTAENFRFDLGSSGGSASDQKFWVSRLPKTLMNLSPLDKTPECRSSILAPPDECPNCNPFWKMPSSVLI